MSCNETSAFEDKTINGSCGVRENLCMGKEYSAVLVAQVAARP